MVKTTNLWAAGSRRGNAFPKLFVSPLACWISSWQHLFLALSGVGVNCRISTRQHFVRQVLGSRWATGSLRGNIFPQQFLGSSYSSQQHFSQLFPGPLWVAGCRRDKKFPSDFLASMDCWISPQQPFNYIWRPHGLLDLVAAKLVTAISGAPIGCWNSSRQNFPYLTQGPYALLDLVTATLFLAIV